MYPGLEDHQVQEPDRGSEKSNREGIHLILISSVFSELSVAFGTLLDKRRGRGDFYNTMKLPKLFRGTLWDAASVDKLYFTGVGGGGGACDNTVQWDGSLVWNLKCPHKHI